MGNLLSKNKTNETQNPNSVWGFGGSESTVGGLYFSSNGNVVRIYYRPNSNRICTVFVGSKPFIPTGIEITIDDKKTLSVFFMNGENRVGEPLMWEETQYEIGINNELLSIEKKTSKEKAPPKKRGFQNMESVDMTRALNSGHVISHRGIFRGGNAENLPSRSFLGAGEVPAGELVRVIPSEDTVFADVTIINMDDLFPSHRSQAVISSAEVQQMNNPFGGQTVVLQEPLSMALRSSEKNVFQESPMTGSALEISQTFGWSRKDISHIGQCFGAIGMKTPLTEFDGLEKTFNVSKDSRSIFWTTQSGVKNASLGISWDQIKNIEVFPVSFPESYIKIKAYLILIHHGEDGGSLSISGYSNMRTSTNFTPIPATPFECYNKTTPVVFDKLMFDSETVFTVYLSNKTSRKYSINTNWEITPLVAAY